MIALINEILNNEILSIILIIIVCLILFVAIINILASFLRSLDYLAVSLGKKIRSLFILIKQLVLLTVKLIFFPITIYKMIKEHKFYKEFLINNNAMKKVKDI